MSVKPTNKKTVFDNIVGGEFRKWVHNQFGIRQEKLSSQKRDDNTLHFSTNRNAWVRVTSMSILKKDGIVNNLVNKYGENITGDNLAKDFVLQGGVIKRGKNVNEIGLRSGIGRGWFLSDDKAKFPQNSYGGIDIDELGFKPMPGITDISIGTGGKLGVLKEVKISFKCYNLAQLEIIDVLYMKLGFSLFIEFGHTNYFKNDGNFERNPLPLDPWKYGTKEELLQAISIKERTTNGNWGGLLGTVKNFAWSAQKDGSYDCNIEVVGAGDILESLRSNQNSEKASAITVFSGGDGTNDRVQDDVDDEDQKDYLPSVVSQRNSSTFANILFALYEFGISNYSFQRKNFIDNPPPDVIEVTGKEDRNKNYRKLLNNIFGNSSYKFLSFDNEGKINEGDSSAKPNTEGFNRYLASKGNSYHAIQHYYQKSQDEDIEAPTTVPSRTFNLYVAGFRTDGYGRNVDANDDFDDEGKPSVYITLGNLLAIMNMHCNIFKGKSKTEVSPYVYIDFHPEYTFCNTNASQFSVDPQTALIPFRDKGGFLKLAQNNQINEGLNDEETTFGIKYGASATQGEVLAGGTMGGLVKNLFSPSPVIRNSALLALGARLDNAFGIGPESSAKVVKIMKAVRELNNIKDTEDDDVNKLTGRINKHNPFYDENDDSRGKLMDVLINVNFVATELDRLKGGDPKQSVSTAELINTILQGIQKALGGVNNFRLIPDDETNVLRIFDDKVSDPAKVKYTELKVLGLGNTVYEYGYNSKISNELATQIVIASQAQPESINEDDFAFSHLSQGIEDRIQPVKITADIDSTGNPSQGVDDDGNSPLTSLVLYLRDIYCVMEYVASDLDSVQDTAFRALQKVNSQDTKKKGQTIIPLDFDMTFDGITGIIPNQAFIIDKKRLPTQYLMSNGNPKVAFILHTVHHDFKSNKWTTKISGQTINIDYEGKENEAAAQEVIDNAASNASNQPPKKPKKYNNSGGGSQPVNSNAGSGATGEYFPAGCPDDTGPKDYTRPNFSGFEDYKGIRIYYGKGKIPSKSSQQFENVKLIIDASQSIGFNAAGCIGVLSVVGKESSFQCKGENMNYSVEGARKTFNKIISEKLGANYTDDQLLEYLPRGTGSPEKFAELVYGERSGTPKGEGWLYRGSGFNQLTHKSSYEKRSKLRNKYFEPSVDLMSNPDLMREPWYAAQIAAVFLADRVINKQGVDIGNFPNVDSAIVHCAFANSTNAKTIPCDIRNVNLDGDRPDNDNTKRRKYYSAKKKGAIYFELTPGTSSANNSSTNNAPKPSPTPSVPTPSPSVAATSTIVVNSSSGPWRLLDSKTTYKDVNGQRMYTVTVTVLNESNNKTGVGVATGNGGLSTLKNFATTKAKANTLK